MSDQDVRRVKPGERQRGLKQQEVYAGAQELTLVNSHGDWETFLPVRFPTAFGMRFTLLCTKHRQETRGPL